MKKKLKIVNGKIVIGVLHSDYVRVLPDKAYVLKENDIVCRPGACPDLIWENEQYARIDLMPDGPYCGFIAGEGVEGRRPWWNTHDFRWFLRHFMGPRRKFEIWKRNVAMKMNPHYSAPLPLP